VENQEWQGTQVFLRFLRIVVQPLEKAHFVALRKMPQTIVGHPQQKSLMIKVEETMEVEILVESHSVSDV
jgi:hypothetical protein